MANFFTRLVARTLGPPAADGMVQPVLTSMFAPGPGDGAIGEWTDPDRLPADLSRLLPEAEVPTNSLGLVPSNDAPIAPIAAPVSPPSLLRHSHITVSEPLDSALPQAAPTASPNSPAASAATDRTTIPIRAESARSHLATNPNPPVAPIAASITPRIDPAIAGNRSSAQASSAEASELTPSQANAVSVAGSHDEPGRAATLPLGAPAVPVTDIIQRRIDPTATGDLVRPLDSFTAAPLVAATPTVIPTPIPTPTPTPTVVPDGSSQEWPKVLTPRSETEIFPSPAIAPPPEIVEQGNPSPSPPALPGPGLTAQPQQFGATPSGARADRSPLALVPGMMPDRELSIAARAPDLSHPAMPVLPLVAGSPINAPAVMQRRLNEADPTAAVIAAAASVAPWAGPGTQSGEPLGTADALTLPLVSIAAPRLGAPNPAPPLVNPGLGPLLPQVDAASATSASLTQEGNSPPPTAAMTPLSRIAAIAPLLVPRDRRIAPTAQRFDAPTDSTFATVPAGVMASRATTENANSGELVSGSDGPIGPLLPRVTTPVEPFSQSEQQFKTQWQPQPQSDALSLTPLQTGDFLNAVALPSRQTGFSQRLLRGGDRLIDPSGINPVMNAGRVDASIGRSDRRDRQDLASIGRYGESVGRRDELVGRYGESVGRRDESAGRYGESVGRRDESASLLRPQLPISPTIQITIGRVEVRGISPTPAARARSVARPALSLDAYLKQRGGSAR